MDYVLDDYTTKDEKCQEFLSNLKILSEPKTETTRTNTENSLPQFAEFREFESETETLIKIDSMRPEVTAENILTQEVFTPIYSMWHKIEVEIYLAELRQSAKNFKLVTEFDNIARLHKKASDERFKKIEKERAESALIDIVTEEEDTQEPKQTQSQKLLELIGAKGVWTFRDELKVAYAVIPHDNYNVVENIRGSNFKAWLQFIYYGEYKSTIGSEGINGALSVLEGRALFGKHSQSIPLEVRVTEHNGSFWYDLTSDKWSAVRISKGEWKIVETPPIMFRRYNHQAAQANPIQGGDISLILNHLNLKDSKLLFLCWLVSCFIPKIPHPMPIIHGEKGAAKTTASEFLKSIIDPSSLETSTLQKDDRSMIVNLQENYFLPLDNVSYLSEEMSDILCRAITGSGIQRRKLFTDDESVILKFMRCIALNGINNVATKSDLLDRSILLNLERITEQNRKEIAIVKADFERDKPYILGGIFDTLAKAMTIYPNVKLDKLPRMADFSRWGYAIAEALKQGGGEQFLREYNENREIQNKEVIDNDTVATLIVEFMKERDEWEGNATELRNALIECAESLGINTKSKNFPADPPRLAKRLNSIKSNLESVGITFEKDRENKNRTLSFKNSNLLSLPSLLSQTPPLRQFSSDSKNYLPSQNNYLPSPNDSIPSPNDFTVTATVTEKVPENTRFFRPSDSSDSNDGKIPILKGRI